MRESYDGRFVTFPCYVVDAGKNFKLGQWYEPNPLIYASDALSYDDKSLAALRWDGVIDTITHLPGTQFFYGPILPDEPTYVTSAVVTGDLWPTMSFFTGNAGENGEGTMNIPFNGLAPTKSGNRITTTPGYFDYGQARSRSRLCTRHARRAPEMRADDTCAATRAARRCYAMRAAGAASYALACTRREALAVLQQRS